MQALTWMLISLLGGMSAVQTSPLCPTLLAPPFYSASVAPLSEPPALTVDSRDSTFMFTLRKGRLKPQVEVLLREHFAVQHVVWNAPEGLVWPADYQLQAANVASMIESLLQPYSLQLRLYANHTAVVQPLQHGAQL